MLKIYPIHLARVASRRTAKDYSERLEAKLATIQKRLQEIQREIQDIRPSSPSPKNSPALLNCSPKNMQRQLDLSEKKIVKEELYLSIVDNPGFSLEAHAQKLGITTYLARKCFTSLNCLRMLQSAERKN